MLAAVNFQMYQFVKAVSKNSFSAFDSGLYQTLQGKSICLKPMKPKWLTTKKGSFLASNQFAPQTEEP